MPMNVRYLRRRQRATVYPLRPQARPIIRTARERFVQVAHGCGLEPARALAGLDVLQATGMSEAEAVIFATTTALRSWPPDFIQ